ncbi:MAG: DNA polymerase Y family protein [Saccharofermentanales bacterium]
MDRVILHCDMNNFFASVECLHNPDIRGLPVAVCGAPEFRRGIVLAKNGLAKKMGILTGESTLEARAKVPDLKIVPPHYPLYLKYARLARVIYSEFTDIVTTYGMDEAWLDVSGSAALFGDGVVIADRIRERMKSELGLTVSIGVSFNKIFSKLGSDMRKPDATTVISKENYRDIVWPLPAGDMLFVGSASRHKLFLNRIITIGDLACAPPLTLRRLLGKNGLMLWQFANGDDSMFFPESGNDTLIRSIGNHITPPRNLTSGHDIKLLLYVLADSVATRLRSNKMNASTVKLHVKDSAFRVREFQIGVKNPTQSASDIFYAAMALFSQKYTWQNPVRTIGIRVSGLKHLYFGQLTLFDDTPARDERLDSAIDEIRRRYGYFSIERALLLENKNLSELPVCSEYTVGNGIRKWGE